MKPGNKLLRWYEKNGRKLPWRRTRDPYRILVSEIMLQQTQVERVKTYYRDWLKRFPNWRALAAASNADVLDAWAGLGYNRRALALRDIARQVVEGGEPKTREGWLALKGVGPYTSAAIMAFAFKEAVLPIDTNIRRFGGRFFLGTPYPQPKDDERIEKKSREFLTESKTPYDVPQAIFDLSTMHCTKVPDCSVCPMRNECKAAEKFLSGRVRVPKQMVKKSKETRHRNNKYPDRIYRGRILKLVRERECETILRIGKEVKVDYDDTLDRNWLEAIVDRLVKDEMIARTKKTVKRI